MTDRNDFLAGFYVGFYIGLLTGAILGILIWNLTIACLAP